MRGEQNNALTKELNFAWKPQQKYKKKSLCDRFTAFHC